MLAYNRDINYHFAWSLLIFWKNHYFIYTYFSDMCIFSTEILMNRWKLLLCFIKHNPMNLYEEWRYSSVHSSFQNRMQEISFTPWPLAPRLFLQSLKSLFTVIISFLVVQTLSCVKFQGEFVTLSHYMRTVQMKALWGLFWVRKERPLESLHGP
jgi:hypothetical protein